jgi:hypothetical protein
MSEIKQKKNRLKDDLELLEGSFENRITKLQKNIFGSIKPVTLIRKKPFHAVGFALFAGMALGFAKKKQRASSGNGDSSSSSLKFTGLLLDEVKRIAARRAADYISEFVEQKMSQDK